MATSTRLTLEQFLAIPDFDERRLELIDGHVCEQPVPNWGHARIAIKLGGLLDRFGYAGTEARAMITAWADFGPTSPLPDLAFYRDEPPRDDEWMTRPPHVAVEILSPHQDRRQMRAKIEAYVRFGVESVWVIDPERREIDVYEGGARKTLRGEERLESPAVPGFSASVKDVLDTGRGG